MKAFRTILSKLDWDFEITYPSSHFLIGSCFSEHIGNKLKRAKFSTFLNPFGILYHPDSIARGLNRLLNRKNYSELDLEFEDERYISFDHHGSFNNPNKEVMLSSINDCFSIGGKKLEDADYIYITWGTSVGYFHNTKDIIVSNCHKIPNEQFSKRRSSPESIFKQYQVLFEKIFSVNPKVRIILSVSPVKHLKEGIIENNLSKASLLLAADKLSSAFNKVYYFPSFDLLQDDLRDYRFYAEDMVHPNEIAIDYIWDYFRDNLFSKPTVDLERKINSIQQAIEHRPLHPENTSHEAFVEQTQKRIVALEKEHSFLKF